MSEPIQPTRRRSWPARHKVLTALGVVLVLFIALIVASVATSPTPAPTASTADGPASAAAPSAASGNSAPSNDYIAEQFKIPMDSLSKDAAAYRADVKRDDDANAIQDAGTLYSEVATLPGVLGNERIYGTAATSLPEVMAAAKTYSDALSKVNSGMVGQLKTAEAAVPSAAEGFRTALRGFAVNFGGQVPEV